MTRRYPLTSSKFPSIARTPFFVDKSTLIETFFERECVVLITAPRRFGKSTNMDMIKCFSEIVVDSNGTRIPRNETENYRVFSDSSLNLSVYDPNPKSFFNRHFGQYPVIYIDFKSLSGRSYGSFINSFKIIIYQAYATHGYLLQSSKLNDNDKNMFREFYNNDTLMNINDELLEVSITFLTEYLNIHFNKRIIVLIDEYDCLLYTSTIT